MSKVLCLDSSVLIPYLSPEDLSDQAEQLVLEAISSSYRIVMPSFAWAEVGSVLRKKVRRGVMTKEESEACFQDFQLLPLEFIEQADVRRKAWAIAAQYDLSTLYDAAFLACSEYFQAEFWTADQSLINSLRPCPEYVHSLKSF